MNDLRDIETIILVGGLGTRLHKVVSDRPKILAEIKGRPFIFYLLDQLHEAGLQRVILCTGYKAKFVESTIGKKYRNLIIEYSKEASPLGTGGAVGNAKRIINREWILVMNGDSFADINYRHLVAWHQKKGAKATVVIVPLESTGRYGSVEINQADEVVGFIEKMDTDKLKSAYINAGIYLMHRSIIEELPTERIFSLEREVLPALIGNRFFGYKTGGAFIDIGTPESYRSAEKFFESI